MMLRVRGFHPHAPPDGRLGAGFVSRYRRRRGASTLMVLLLVLVAILAVAASVSVLMTMRAMAARDRAERSMAASATALSNMVTAAANARALKSPAAAADRQAVFQPAVEYYRGVIEENVDDESKLPDVARAQLQLAVLQVKSGSDECAKTLAAAAGTLKKMSEGQYAEAEFPSIQKTVLGATAPLEWGAVKTPNLQSYGLTLLQALQGAATAYRSAAKQNPQAVLFRDDLAALCQTNAQLLSAVPGMEARALRPWLEARDLLETLVRDQPANAEFQSRLVDSLVGAARLQKEDAAQAAANYERAAAVLTQMAEAAPDDKTLQAKLKRVNGDLAKLQEQAAKGAPARPAEDAPADEAAPDDAAAP